MTVSETLNLSESEKDALIELRKSISGDVDKNICDDDYHLYRYLKACSFDPCQAGEMIKKTIKWRKENGIDRIVEDYVPPEVLKMYMKNDRFTFDKNGNSVFYNPLGIYDAKGIYMSARTIDISKSVMLSLERDEPILKEYSKKNNKLLPGHILIADMDGLTFATATDKKAIELFIRVIREYQDHYPGRMKALFVINASAYFQIPFNILKSFLHGSLLDIIQVFGTDGYKEELVKIIDEENLPVFLGGKKTDPDGNPLCKTFMNQGGPIDSKYHTHKSLNSLSGQPDAKKLVLARASFSEIEMRVEEAGSLIQWEFETKTRDIGFGLFFRDGEEKMVELVPLLRLDTEEFAETGMYKCEKVGTYVMLFDNSYSWIRSKEIYYRTAVVSPKEHVAQLAG